MRPWLTEHEEAGRAYADEKARLAAVGSPVGPGHETDPFTRELQTREGPGLRANVMMLFGGLAEIGRHACEY